MDGGNFPIDEYRERDLDAVIGILGSIKTIIENWMNKNPIRNFEKILALLEENDIYLSDIKYDVWQRDPNQFIHLFGNGFVGNGRRYDKGLFLWVDEINNEFLKSLIKVAWDSSIEYDEKEHRFRI